MDFRDTSLCLCVRIGVLEILKMYSKNDMWSVTSVF